ncbi:MAG TPA: hypothetical protein VK211_09430 [Kamptonema sp.]|nr:hypothetical protein [Kamptonema sp.]
MANLPDETLATASMLLLRLFQVINLATATEFNLFEQYGETEETFGELEELKNVAERARVLYNRIYGLMLQVAESQPIANLATMRLLYQSIELAEPTADSGEGSIQEIKRSWNLP